LARARQIPEWEEYDAEIARFARDLAEEGKVQSRMAAADTNVLAGAAVPAAEKGEKGPEGVTEGLEERGLGHDEL
jgi:UDP-glucose:glycoprotein glucosyltransferase